MKERSFPDRKKIPWYPTVDEKKCTGCGICIAYCPHTVFELGETGSISCVVHPYECVVGCSNCERECPEGAISFPDVGEIRKLILELRK